MQPQKLGRGLKLSDTETRGIILSRQRTTKALIRLHILYMDREFFPEILSFNMIVRCFTLKMFMSSVIIRLKIGIFLISKLL